MFSVKLICVGKMKEKFFISAYEEYAKRLGGFCSFELCEIKEQRLSQEPSQNEIDTALAKEAVEIKAAIPSGACVVAMCIEGKLLSSEELSAFIDKQALQGKNKLCFIIGGSCGLDKSVKNSSDLKLSMSKMTFPHHLARVMVAEQIYRAFSISNGNKYHK